MWYTKKKAPIDKKNSTQYKPVDFLVVSAIVKSFRKNRVKEANIFYPICLNFYHH